MCTVDVLSVLSLFMLHLLLVYEYVGAYCLMYNVQQRFLTFLHPFN